MITGEYRALRRAAKIPFGRGGGTSWGLSSAICTAPTDTAQRPPLTPGSMGTDTPLTGPDTALGGSDIELTATDIGGVRALGVDRHEVTRQKKTATQDLP
jgi:hypothetical protein